MLVVLYVWQVHDLCTGTYGQVIFTCLDLYISAASAQFAFPKMSRETFILFVVPLSYFIACNTLFVS